VGNHKIPHPTRSARTISRATITKADYLDRTSDDDATEAREFATQADLEAYIANLESNMRESAQKFKFEKATKHHQSDPRQRVPLFLDENVSLIFSTLLSVLKSGHQ
jgi:excinuclease UvrABC helicase subunit UvrB